MYEPETRGKVTQRWFGCRKLRVNHTMSSSDHLPHSGSPQSSPAPLAGRGLSRPHWPWSTYSHRSSQGSLSALSTGTTRLESWDHQRPSSGSSSSNAMWQSTSTAARRAASGIPVASATQDDLTRHWSFTVSSDHGIWPGFYLTHACIPGI